MPYSPERMGDPVYGAAPVALAVVDDSMPPGAPAGTPPEEWEPPYLRRRNAVAQMAMAARDKGDAAGYTACVDYLVAGDPYAPMPGDDHVVLTRNIVQGD